MDFLAQTAIPICEGYRRSSFVANYLYGRKSYEELTISQTSFQRDGCIQRLAQITFTCQALGVK
eukprot:scaffold34599_cov279-Amphora_coffeaeformis.AAC.1